MPRLELKSNSKRKIIVPKIKSIIEPEVNRWVTSGSDTFNLALSGNINHGYPIGRIINLVGDFSSGKTLLATELCNVIWYYFHIKLGLDVAIQYNDAEFAFDFDLARKLKVPIDKITWSHHETVQDMRTELYRFLDKNSKKDLCLFIEDSLDGLWDKSSKKKFDDESEAGYDAAKRARYISDFFRELKGDISKTNCILPIISQIRENIGVMFGPKYKRNGGRALDFYASQIAWLREIEQLYSNIYKLPSGLTIEALLKKNKVAPPKRFANITIMYNYGIDNYRSLVDFCLEHKILDAGKSEDEEEDDKGARGKFKKKKKRKDKDNVVWDGERFQKKELIKFFEGDKKEYQKLRKMVQAQWDQMENEVNDTRKSKWED
jgi:protein RecA